MDQPRVEKHRIQFTGFTMIKRAARALDLHNERTRDVLHEALAIVIRDATIAELEEMRDGWHLFHETMVQEARKESREYHLGFAAACRTFAEEMEKRIAELKEVEPREGQHIILDLPQGRNGQTKREKEQAAQLKQLTDRVAELEGHLERAVEPRITDLEQAIDWSRV